MLKRITLEHGSGGLLMKRLIEEDILPHINNEHLSLFDSAILNLSSSIVAFTTDSYVVSPIFFNGGDIGRLAVNGTVNDLLMVGARPLFLSLSLILEEGLEFNILEKIMRSISSACKEAGVSIVTGDTKVVPHSQCDQIYINTSGLGIITNKKYLKSIKEGDCILISGTIGDHGATIMAHRAGLMLDSSDLKSDSMPLTRLVLGLLERFGDRIHFLKDPTRGGLATSLCEISSSINKKILVFEENMPINPAVKAVCDILGLDPLYLANEGKCIIICEQEDHEEILKFLWSLNEGNHARMIGFVGSDGNEVVMETVLGGKRLIRPLMGEPFPRIC